MKTRLYETGLIVTDDWRPLQEKLELAFCRELPAFWVSGAQGTWDGMLVLEVSADDSTPDHAFARIPGFGVPGLTLQEVQ